MSECETEEVPRVFLSVSRKHKSEGSTRKHTGKNKKRRKRHENNMNNTFQASGMEAAARLIDADLMR